MNEKASLSKVPFEVIFDASDETADVYQTEKAKKMTLNHEMFYGERMSFENFKSTVCHRLKSIGDLNFIEEVILARSVEVFYKKEWYLESYYILAMLDYVSRKNNIPLCGLYNKMRCGKIEKPVYPEGILRLYLMSKDENILKESFENAIPEFKRFNIIENEIDSVA